MKYIRESKGLTQEELSRLVGCSRSWLMKLENGKVEPKLKIALRIAAALGCTVEEIFHLK
jgi:DNA-binding XRE family transcriptional regulator